MNNIDKNYKYFKENLTKLKKLYPKEYVIICEEKVIFHNKDFNKVIALAKELEAGKFIIQKCETNEANNIQKFHTRVSF